MKAPFPWYGGKGNVADVVWSRFGDVAVYAEPFAGSLAVLLNRPGWSWDVSWVETVSDVDGMLCNAWRAIAADPEAVAHHADWPAIESDLHARHAWLVERKAQLTARLEGDPEYCDAQSAGWWLWGISQWIGGGWCSPCGPWQRVEVAPGDWQLRKGSAGSGISRRLVHLGNSGMGVSGQLVHLGNAGQGVSRRRVHLGSAGQGVSRKLVHLGNSGAGDPGTGECGLLAWMQALAARLRRVRVCCGDWKRILTPSALAPGVGGPRGIFLDPPYSADAGRDMGCYGDHDDGEVAHAVRAWAIEAGRDHDMRIALCGYEGEGHDHLVEDHGWTCHGWAAHGGMSNDRGRNSGGNNTRERIWFSPGCERVTARVQLGLFDAPLNAERP